MHRRISPVRHKFSYRVFALLLDIDAIEITAKNFRLFSYNRFNIFSFYDKDHGNRNGTDIRTWINQQFDEVGLNCPKGQVFLFSIPRVMGYVFNPLSIYFCHHCNGKLAAILYEVKNTHGEQHCYVLPANESNSFGSLFTHKNNKEFFVSPFIEMKALYKSRVSIKSEQLSLLINVLGDSGSTMTATLIAKAEKLSDCSLLTALVKDPGIAIKVISGIHFEAARLWVKKVPFYKFISATNSEN